MKLVGRIQVEPLDDERLTNIERRIVAGAADAAARPLRESRGSLALAFAAVVVLAVGGVVGWKVRGGGPEPAAVAEAAPLTIQTGAEGSSIDLGDARIASDRETSYTVTRPAGGVLVALARGKVSLDVDKRGGRPPLVVRAGDTDVVVIGTQFSVDFGDGTGAVDVRVTEGVVKVVRRAEETRVAAGFTWHTDRGLLAADALAKLERELVAKAAEVEAKIELGHGPAPDVSLKGRVAKVPEARITTSGTVTRPQPERVGTATPARPRTLDAATDPYVDLKTRIRREPVLPPADIGETDPNRAIDKHWEIFNASRGEAASRALYSIAYLQAMKLGRTSNATRTLEIYMRRFQGGAEYEAALWLRVRTLCLATVDDHCRKAAYTYVHEASDTRARELAERITTAQ